MLLRRWLVDLIQDVRYGVRSLAARPTFTAIALLTLTVGIGANGLIFTVVSGVLLRPLPYAESDRLVQVYGTNPPFGRGAVPNVPAYRVASTQIETLAGYVPGTRVLNGAAGAERVGVVRAERSLFRVLHSTPPVAGRTFRDDDPAGTTVVAASTARRLFGSEAAAVGQSLTLEGRTSGIVGVMPDEFRFPYERGTYGRLARPPYEIWEVLDLPANPRTRFDRVIGRLQSGATRASAQGELDAISRRLAAEDPERNAGRGVELVPLEDDVIGPVRTQLFILLGAVGLVLVIACANVANLLLVRGAARSREFAVRTAIGAGRGRLTRQVLAESMLLGCAGGALALLVVKSGLPALLASPGLDVPRATEIDVDWRVVGFLLAASLATSVLFGLIPAWAASSINAQEILKSGGALGRSGRTQGRFRDVLAVSEIAVAFVLVIGAGLLVREFQRLRVTSTGMNTANVVTMHLAPNLSAADCHAIAGAVETLPGVGTAAFTQMLPLQSWGWSATFSIPGRAPATLGERPTVELRYITPGYFEALGVPILRGRAFTDADTPASEPVIIVNDALVRKYLRGIDPIGQKTDRGVIVGVAGDVRQAGLDRETMPDIYYPMAQNVSQLGHLGMTLIVKAEGQPGGLTASIRAAIARTHPQVAVFGIAMMDDVVGDSLSGTAFYSWLIGSFALLALVVACAGIYGVMASIVASRTREFGIRLALGCNRRRVEGLVLRHAAVLAGAGLVVGGGAALLCARFLESLVVGASRLEAATMTGSAVVLAAVALFASAVPAYRASRVDPMAALRQE